MELVLWIIAAELLVLIAISLMGVKTLLMVLEYSEYINKNVVNATFRMK